MSDVVVLVDFGSTYTKAVAIDLQEECIVGQGKAHSTVGSDVMIGLDEALQRLRADAGPRLGTVKATLACSSAAGGLRMAVVGLTPSLSLKAGRLAALGAGAKLEGVYAYKLNRSEIAAMEALAPDIILLVGGTDGGNEEVIRHNAQRIAESRLQVPVVVAGNKSCADDVEDLLRTGNRLVRVVPNVLREHDQLNVEPSREAIREIFMDRIVHAKGLDEAARTLGQLIMPTPMAVLKGAELLGAGHGAEPGLGELIVVDIGGATTDVHSIAHGLPTQQGVVRRGIAEPFAKRTVEGDLGLRWNAGSILEAVGAEALLADMAERDDAFDLPAEVARLVGRPDTVPQTPAQKWLDVALARHATRLALERHAGRLESVYTENGEAFIQSGKDLTQVRCVLGTGGIFVHGEHPAEILAGALYAPDMPLSLKPRAPAFLVDHSYILYAIGLLASVAPDKALRVAKKYMLPVSA